jgi:hypothetical protein
MCVIAKLNSMPKRYWEPVFFSILFLSCGSASADCLLRQDVAIHGPANCREKLNGKILRSLPDQTKVDVLERSGDWYQVRLGTMTCWTAKQNLRSDPKDPIPSSKVCGDSLSEEDNEFLESLSVKNPPLSEMIGADGKPLQNTPTAEKKRQRK